MGGSGKTYVSTSLPVSGERITYLIQVSRPHFWAHLTVVVLVAILLAADSLSQVLSPVALWFVLYFSLPANLFVYGLNDMFDTETDELNPRKSSHDSRENPFRWDTTNVATVLASGALVGSVVLVTTDPLVLALLGAGLVANLLYNLPPFRLKTVPVVDSLLNASFVFPPLAAYVAIDGSLPPLAAIAGLGVWAMGYHALAAIPDVEADRTVGIDTIATFLGPTRTYAYCVGTWLVAAALFALAHPAVGVLFLAFPAYLVYVVYAGADAQSILYRASVLCTAVFGACGGALVVTLG